MKKVTFIALFAATVLTSGLTTYLVTKTTAKGGTKTQSGFVEYNDKVPTHFTNYQQANYPDLTYAAENAVQAVVSIQKKQEVRSSQGYYGGGGIEQFYEFFGIPRQQRGESSPRILNSSGSGVIITPDGYIVSNNHVIEDASELTVTLYDGRSYDAKIIGTDPTTDIALIKIEEEKLPFLPFGNSDELRLGEWVLAIGTPFSLESTITAGIVSAKSRSLGVIEEELGIESFIQTDAAVNPGNSGGALVNTKGELVGINTVIKSPTGTFAGYSFAVPSVIVKKVAMDLRDHGAVQRALLGIQYIGVTDSFIKEMGEETGIKERGGVYVAEVVEGGAAEAAGIKKGDVVTEINGMKVGPYATNLQEIIAQHRPNDKVKISAKRGNSVKQFDVVLRNKAGKTDIVSKEVPEIAEKLGGKFLDISAKEKKDFKIDFGIMVAEVENEGILKQAGIKKGYIITHINDRPIRSVNDLSKITSSVESIQAVSPDGQVFRSYNMAR